MKVPGETRPANMTVAGKPPICTTGQGFGSVPPCVSAPLTTGTSFNWVGNRLPRKSALCQQYPGAQSGLEKPAGARVDPFSDTHVLGAISGVSPNALAARGPTPGGGVKEPEVEQIRTTLFSV